MGSNHRAHVHFKLRRHGAYSQTRLDAVLEACDPEITRLNELLFQNTQRNRETGTTNLNLDRIRQFLNSNPQDTINTSFLILPQVK